MAHARAGEKLASPKRRRAPADFDPILITPALGHSLSAPGGGEGRVRWGIPGRSPAPPSPSHRWAMGPSLSPLKGGEGLFFRHLSELLGAVAVGEGVEALVGVTPGEKAAQQRFETVRHLVGRDVAGDLAAQDRFTSAA